MMKSRTTHFMRACTVVLFAFAATAALAGPNRADDKRPNIIFLFADDWGWGDLSCHGSKMVKTPNLDKLASQGMEFTQFTVNNPVCSPSRTAVMTGQFPARHCIHEHFNNIAHHKKTGMPDWLDPKLVMLPHLFQAAGYKTAHFGKWHLTNGQVPDAPLPTAYGYDETGVFNGHGPQISMADSSTYDKTIGFIRKHKDSPFFINVWMHQTHTPHYPKEKFLKKFKDLDEQHRVYAAIVAEGDHGVGQIMKVLDELDLANDTLIIFSSDNGPEGTLGPNQKIHGKNKKPTPTEPTPLGRYYSVGSTGGLKGRKRSLFEGGVRVPFIVRWPGKVPVGKTNKTTVITAVDLLPTFCGAAGISLPDGYRPDGENMLEALMGKDVTRTKPIFWQWKGTHNGANWPELGVREGQWKLVIAADGNRKELYNIPKDRAEKANLANQQPEIVKKLSAKVLAWKETLPKNPPKHCISKLRKQEGGRPQ